MLSLTAGGRPASKPDMRPNWKQWEKYEQQQQAMEDAYMDFDEASPPARKSRRGGRGQGGGRGGRGGKRKAAEPFPPAVTPEQKQMRASGRPEAMES